MVQAPLGVPYIWPASYPPVPVLSHTGIALVSGNQVLNPMSYVGSTIYPAASGFDRLWHDPIAAPPFVDSMLTLYAQSGMNLVRLTDLFNSGLGGQQFDDPVVWTNVDYLVTQATKKGYKVIMDLSFFGKIIQAAGFSVTQDASRWYPYLDAIGAHYMSCPTIAWYSIWGEPSLPVTGTDVTSITVFYASTIARLKVADPNHMVGPGGLIFTNQNTTLGWWQSIVGLPACDLMQFELYSPGDQQMLPTEAAFAAANNKALLCNEFGMPQDQGDGSWTGLTYNGFTESRSALYQQNYALAKGNSAGSAIFWNLGWQQQSTGFDVNPFFPATWSTIQQNTPNTPIAAPRCGG